MYHVIFTVGIPASGKSSFAAQKEKEGYVIIERDQIRRQMVEEQLGHPITGSLWANYKFNKTNESTVTARENALVDFHTEKGHDIVISETNLNQGRLSARILDFERRGYDVDVEVFPIGLKEAITRDRDRTDSVGVEVMHGMWKQWLALGTEITGIYQYQPNTDLPTAIICDIDGTLAHITVNADGKRRDVYDYMRAGEDAIDEIVYSMVMGLYNAGHKIIIMSGRDDIGKGVLVKWLDQYDVPYEEIHMRTAGDKRADRDVKLDLFKDVETRWNVIAAIDDRDSVIELWSDIGVKTVDVGHRYEHF